MLKLLCILAIAGLSLQIKPYQLNLSSTEKAQEASFSYKNNSNQNHFEVSLEDIELNDGEVFSLILESENSDFMLSILPVDGSKPKQSTLMDLTSESGNIALIMSNTYFNGNLDFFKAYGKLRFMVYNGSEKGPLDYRIKVQVGDRVDASMGRVYASRIDATLKEMRVHLTYNGSEQEELQKLRFQLTAVRYKQNYSLNATLRHKSYSFKLNNIFQKAIGGILTAPDLPVCLESVCAYDLDVKLNGIKSMNIESYLIGKIEKLSIDHYEEYYDKVYKADALTTYELPYETSMHGMDISISIIPVTGSTGLYVNPKTLPLDLNKYTWQEKGPLAKRITIKWEELIQMNADGTNLFITVQSVSPGEFLIKLDAHDPGLRGRLNSGIIEAGFVKHQEISNYLYLFEVFETQDITFDLRLGVISGDADLYVKQCEDYQNCKIDENDIGKSNVLKVENNQSIKTIRHSFTCTYKKKHTATLCEFIIGVKGKENQGTHYDITLHESKHHRLMIPGHSIAVNMVKEEVVFLKFSYPNKSNKNMKLYLAVEPQWGNFKLLMSKTNAYPTEDNATFERSFYTTNTGLLQLMENIEIDEKLFNEYSVQGIYYIAVIAETSCSLNLRFHEKMGAETTLHSLTAGVQVRGEISNPDEIMYYTMKLSLDHSKASTVSINITPIKGRFTMFMSKNGKLPTKEDNELISENNILDFVYDEYNNAHEEYIIGVQMIDDSLGDNETTQFLISFTYSDKPTLLAPGVVSTHMVQESNQFLIQIIEEMESLLVLKSIVDGYNIDICASISATDKGNSASCDYKINERDVSLYLERAELQRACNAIKKQNKICYMHLSVKGNKNQKLSIGYTYNDHPFQIVHAQVINGPLILSKKHPLRFICHPEHNKDFGLYLNTKGSHMKMYTKLVRSSSVHNEKAIVFPTAGNYDESNQASKGHITNVWYSVEAIKRMGNSPEILVSILAEHPESDPKSPFDPSRSFVLQSATDSMEILRTQTHVELVNPGAWNYYHFYNNGNSNELRIYSSSNIATQLELVVSRNLHSRPPFTNKPLVRKVGLQSVELKLQPEDLKFDTTGTDHSLKGHYTIGVKSADGGMLSLYWNNKEDLNYIELTPGEPSIMHVDSTKRLYFSLYAQDVNKKAKDLGSIEIYIKSNIPVTVYMLKTKGKSLDAPSKHKFNWKATLGHMGGITSITVEPKDAEYCMNCNYIGYIESQETGSVSLIANIEHQSIPVLLSPGFTLPVRLESDQSKMFRFFNHDTEVADLIVSMLSGGMDVLIGDKQEINKDDNLDAITFVKNLDIHKFISIDPKKYNITEPQDFYILAENNQKVPASFTIGIEKNEMKTPIEPGLTKYMRLGPGEHNEMYYKPKPGEKTIEVELELRQIMNPLFVFQAMVIMHEFLNVYHYDEKGDRHLLMYKSKSIQDNRIYIIFDIKNNNEGTFAVNVLNPLKTGVYVSVYLSNGGYKLVHLNDYSTSMIKGSESQIFEIHSEEDKYVFFDLNTCIGDVNVSFYQSDYDKIESQSTAEYKTVKDANKFIHYLKVENKRILLEVTNSNTDLSIFEMVAYSEKDLETNPISEIIQGDGGKVTVETDNFMLRMNPIKINSQNKDDFTYRITYRAYLTQDFKVMRYAKSCGRYKIDHAFKNHHLKVFDTTVNYNDIDEANNIKKILIPMNHLERNTKYFGVVVATVELMPLEEGYISPVRSTKAYYDEFIFVTPRYHIPPIYVISVLGVLAFLIVVFCCVKGYVFGQINRLDGLERISDLPAFDESTLGRGIMGMLESEYFEEKNNVSTTESVNETTRENGVSENDEKTDDGHEIELSESKEKEKPLSE